ncbi:hypothetical protein WJX73_003460 [Symbiochloris irregularis]|uniref:F-box domain-containing protein n=1 Tax=Symbiochloris irregularis TaxID=706552 RepID=A0AAW1NUX1_9CHLO
MGESLAMGTGIRRCLSLPDSVWYRILKASDFKSKVRCERVNRQLNNLLKQPGLWSDIELTLENLVGDNDSLYKERLSPAARWTLARMSTSCARPPFETWIWLSGDARHIVESFSVPCFFALLEERKIDYSLSAILWGRRLSR